MEAPSSNSMPSWEHNPHPPYFNTQLNEVWAYRHLLLRLIRRDFLVNYQQTILGPLWVLFQPLITLATYVIVFNKMVGVSTGEVPPVLFYMASIILWNLFSDSFIGTAFIFKDNISVFSKVYFPRLVVPLATVGTTLSRFIIQVGMLVVVMLGYWFYNRFTPSLHWSLVLMPVSILFTAFFGLGLGLIFSVLTAKYRDLANLAHLGVRLLLFFTPVIYPLSIIPDQARFWIQLNPLTQLFEAFRLALFNIGDFDLLNLSVSCSVIILLSLLSLFWFNRSSDRLIDIV